jgi:immune inhibitor A
MENCWAYIEGTGWRKIQTGSTDGVTNLYMIMNTARANDRLVHVNIDGANRITSAYLK